MKIFMQALRAMVSFDHHWTLKKLRNTVRSIRQWERKLSPLSNDDLKAETKKLQEQLQQGQTLEQILPRAFATMSLACQRVLQLTPFDVQLMGGIVLHQGKIVEMKTGEGKSLTASFPLFLNALTKNGCFLVTVNDYLATRDAHEIGKVFQWMGLTVGVVTTKMLSHERKSAYLADITYITNKELAFDYLRDSLKNTLDDQVQRDFSFCIVDEADSILIDEARTPLIISGRNEENDNHLTLIDQLAKKLQREKHFTVDEKTRDVSLTEEGCGEVEKSFDSVGIKYEGIRMNYLFNDVHQSLKAHTLFHRDVDYIVKDGKVVLIDEFTGRLKRSSRLQEGIHQAIEAKENVVIKKDGSAAASISFQNFFRLFAKLSGMTGTAATDSVEFSKIYNLDVVVIPTHKRCIRYDHADNEQIFFTQAEKNAALAALIKELNQEGRPALIGTPSVKSSEILSHELSKQGVPHEVLNAKNHQQEAQIVSTAGDLARITIATNMAGRGTDIKLTDETRKLGGLFVIGTERHEARRIDLQLMGRSGRQGDPGESLFFLSAEDELPRVYLSDSEKKSLHKYIEKIHGAKSPKQTRKWTRKASEIFQTCQQRQELKNYLSRKYLLDYDNVIHQQREIIYGLKRSLLLGDESEFLQFFELYLENLQNQATLNSINFIALRPLFLVALDEFWQQHLQNIEEIKKLGQFSYLGNKDPLVNFRLNTFKLFDELGPYVRDVIHKALETAIIQEPQIPVK